MKIKENRSGVRTIIILLLLTVSPCANAQSSKGTLSIDFIHCIDQDTLRLDTLAYKNAVDQMYSITKFRYYISNIVLTKINGGKTIIPACFLIDEEKEESKRILLNAIPPGEYSMVSFTIGVDSLHNCSGAQSGALDPVNAMFWTWNSGYIFLKLEGKSNSSSAPGKIFEYHIGGYRFPNNCIRRIDLPLASTLKIERNQTAALKVKVNLAEIFRGPESIDFAELPSVTDKDHATMIADNYMDIFSVIR